MTLSPIGSSKRVVITGRKPLSEQPDPQKTAKPCDDGEYAPQGDLFAPRTTNQPRSAIREISAGTTDSEAEPEAEIEPDPEAEGEVEIGEVSAAGSEAETAAEVEATPSIEEAELPQAAYDAPSMSSAVHEEPEAAKLLEALEAYRTRVKQLMRGNQAS